MQTFSIVILICKSYECHAQFLEIATFPQAFEGRKLLQTPQNYPPGTKPIHAGKNSRGNNFCANTCGACICFRANTGKDFWGIIVRILAKFLRESFRCEYMSRLYSHPREYRKVLLGNYLCIGFVPGGISQGITFVRSSCQRVLGDNEMSTKFSVHNLVLVSQPPPPLVAPYRAILRYYRCDTPYRAILFQGS